ncbi:Uncharacterised protein [BD1-7 clade bacterium]|uniref:SbsA Ig-like domain-containing protein n=1 Tax=BD1-7 clade bacterium TaxID=2029982 RepID=A0A5S9PN40_9GAMM|nr:Uncharacterised protein [BD1-7 clade bacterium]
MQSTVFKKAKLATAVAMATGAIFLAGCEENKTTTEDSDRFEVIQQKVLNTSVFGIVQDTNGNPVRNARISIGGINTRTDESGAYRLKDVPVTGFGQNIVNGEVIAGATGTPLTISISSATGYLPATVQVTPVAGSTLVQTATAEGGSESGNDKDSLVAIIIQNGVAVSAGLTVVPKIDAAVEGVLRDRTTGLEIPNAIVALEFLGVNGVEQQQQQNDNDGDNDGTGYGSLTFQAVTNDQGLFEFPALPADSDFEIIVQSWNTEDLGFQGDGMLGKTSISDADIATTPEVAKQHIGDVMVDPIYSNDLVSPFTTKVDGVVSATASRGMLNDDLDGTQGIVVHFNEPMAKIIDDNSVYIVDKMNDALVDIQSITLSEDATYLTVTTAAPIGMGIDFDIYLNKVDFEDGSENTLAHQSQPEEFLGKPTPAYTYDESLASIESYTIKLKTYEPPLTQSGAVTNLTQIAEDPAGTQFTLLRGLNKNFASVDYTSDDVEQLNSNEDGNTGERLRALAAATLNEAPIAGQDAPDDVLTDSARIHFDVAEAEIYTITIRSQRGADRIVNIDLVDNDAGDLADNGTDEAAFKVDADFGNTTVAMILREVEENDVVTITSINGLGMSVATASLTLVDTVAPTTVLQNSYGYKSENTNGVAGLAYGQGGELSDIIADSNLGTPLLNLTPRLLVPQDPTTGIALPVGDIWNSLTNGIKQEENNAGLMVDWVNTTSNIPSDIVVYDETAFTNWNAGARRIGIAFSEDVTLSGNPALPVGADFNAFMAQNNVVQNDQSNRISVTDLISFQTSDVLAAANNHDGDVIDFTGVIADATANASTADDNARVVIKDRMPAMATKATYTGEAIIVEFNEPVSLREGADFTLRGISSSITVDISEATATANQNTTTVTIPFTDENWYSALSVNQLFNRQVSTDDDATELSVLVYDDVADAPLAAQRLSAQDVTWTTWDGGDNEVKTPAIVIESALPELQVNIATAGFENARELGFTVTYTSNHRINLNQLLPGLADQAKTRKLTAAQVAQAFRLTGTAQISGSETPANNSGAPSGAVLSSDGKTLMVRINTNGVGLANSDSFSTVRNFGSAYDNSAFIGANDLSQQIP